MTKLPQTFPVRLATQWQSEPKQLLQPTLFNWLYDPSSLTARLKRYCQHFRVDVIGQRVEACQSEEANGNIVSGEQVLVREVVLYCDEQPQVFARSLLPLSSLTGEEQQLAHLGTQPLGQVLFNNPLLERRSIEVSVFDQHSTVAQFAQQLSLGLSHDIWGRRSLFILNHKPIMVAEVFLPNAFAYVQGVYL